MALSFDAYKSLNGAHSRMGSGLSAPGNGSVGGLQVEFFYQSL